MKTLRWIVCVPLAMMASLLTWAGVKKFVPSSFYSGGQSMIENALALLPLILAAILPNIVFALVGAMTAPTVGKAVSFVFFGLTFCLSAGGLDIALTRAPEFRVFFVAASISYVAGAVLGLAASLRLQQHRREKLPASIMLTPPPAAR